MLLTVIDRFNDRDKFQINTMNSKEIQRYNKKSLPNLLKIAERHVNKYIRERDSWRGCVSCGRPFQNAGHFYSVGGYGAMRFNVDNIHGQCIHCNKHLHGNLNEYRKRLEIRIGKERLLELDRIASIYKRGGFKWDRFTVIEIIIRFKVLNKNN